MPIFVSHRVSSNHELTDRERSTACHHAFCTATKPSRNHSHENLPLHDENARGEQQTRHKGDFPFQ